MAAWAVRGATPFLLKALPPEAGFGLRGQVHAEGVPQSKRLITPSYWEDAVLLLDGAH
jgi:hypothetical protein